MSSWPAAVPRPWRTQRWTSGAPFSGLLRDIARSFDGDNEAARSAAGWYKAAEAFARRCQQARPGDPGCEALVTHVMKQHGRLPQ